MWTFMTLEVRTDATTRPKAAFTASKLAAGVTPLASMLLMALWWASAAALRRLPPWHCLSQSFCPRLYSPEQMGHSGSHRHGFKGQCTVVGPGPICAEAHVIGLEAL